MKFRSLSLALLAATAIAAGGCSSSWYGSGGHRSQSAASLSVGAYYDDLAPYGTWIDLDPYGWVWCPLDVEAGWRPYTIGSWAYTDDGWFWLAEDPWGDIPYHYGRWTFDPDYGWIWVPGDVWAPAWVAWRYGTGWIGWAPLPPDVRWQTNVGLVYSAFDLDRHIRRRRWCFSKASDFGTTRVRVRVEPTGKNVTLLGLTKDVTKYDIVDSRPVERGLRPEWIERETNRKVERYRVTDTEKPRGTSATAIRDGSVEVFRPKEGVTEVVRERVKDVPPAQRPVPPPKAIERLEQERTKFEERARTQREQLNKEHQQETAEQRSNVTGRDLRKRQEAEMKAQRESEDQERRAVEEREKRMTEERNKRTKVRKDEPTTPDQSDEPSQKDEGRGRRGK